MKTENVQETCNELAKRLALKDGHPDKIGILADMQDAMWKHGPEAVFRAIAKALQSLEN